MRANSPGVSFLNEPPPMKHFFTGLAALATSLSAHAQLDCAEILQVSFNPLVQGNVVVFNNGTLSQFPNSTDFLWQFGDGGSSTDLTVTHVYAAAGTYQVCLYGFVENCVDTICQQVVVGGGSSPCDELDAEFSYDADGAEVSFDNVSTSNDIAYQWYFGDGTTEGGQDPVHIYPEAGTYAACLVTWAWDPEVQDTCFAENCELVVVEAGDPCSALNAGFFANTYPLGAQFSNATTGTGFQTTWAWSFGDGSTSNDPQPGHTYDLAGAYYVCLTAVSLYEQQGGGVLTCVDTTCQQVIIPGSTSPCDSLSAFFVATTETNVTAFSAFGGTALGYSWSFGDGTEGSGAAPTHTYPGPGTYQACLVTWTWDPQTQDTCYADLCLWITIVGSDPCDTLQSCFTWEGTGTTLFFDNCSNMNGMGPWYHWDFGDGTQSDAISPTHTFPGPGAYTVCLSGWLANSPDSCVSTICHDVVVGDGTPCDSLIANFGVTMQENLAAFTAFGGSAIGYLWNFGDGTEGNGASPVHTYPGPGAYNACLITWTWDPQTQDTCYADQCQWIIIGGGDPCDTIQSCFTWQGSGASFFFDNCSSINGLGPWYLWDFGDGTQSDAISPTHTFPGPGIYTVCLTGWLSNSPDSCVSTICHDVVVGGDESPCDSLSAFFVVTIQNNVAAFSTFGGTAVGYNWYFGDGTEGDGPAPAHTYPGGGTYHACLMTWAWDPQAQDTCYAEHCEWIAIGGSGPCDELQAGFEAIVGDATVWFSNTTAGTGFQTTWQWDFGDGTTSNDAQPAHIFPGLGTYEVCLIATSIYEQQGGGMITCQDSTCQMVITGVGSPCDSLFADFVVTGIETQAVFTGFGGTAIGYHWLFGDGEEGDGPTQVHVYPGPGSYNVCLITWTWDPQTQDTCYAEYCEWLTIGGGTPCDSLEAHFVWEPAGPNVFLFQDASFTNGQDVSYWWSFGDGTNADGPNPDHLYVQPGEYTVCLTITALNSPDSCTSTTCQTLIVQGGSSPCENLNAEFTTQVSGNTVVVLAGINPLGTSYAWLFGDGTSGDGPNTSHTYPGPGVYNLCLIVGNYDPLTQDSCFEDHCQLITLQSGGSICDSLWTANFEFGHQGNVYTFFNTSETQGAEVSTWWTFGDGTFGDGSQLVHTYAASGNYTVCMTISGIIPGTSDSCQVELCQSIEVSVGLADLIGISHFHAWPQPFDSELQLECADLEGLTRFRLLDMTGRLVDDQRFLAPGRITLDYGHLPRGAYILRITNAGTEHSIRVVKR